MSKYIKKYWQKVVALSLLVTMVASNFFFFQASNVLAATFHWMQTDWSGGADTTAFPLHPANQTGWTRFFARDAGIDISAPGQLTLTPTPASVTQTTDTDFRAGTFVRTEVFGAGPAAEVRIRWLTGWSHRRMITINNLANPSTLTDYQVLITTDTAALFTARRMRPDCGDIRFTDSDGTTLISYWIESGCNTATTRIWARVPSIAGNATRPIYMYYGNPGALSASSGSATFDFFDDFEYADAITTRGWIIGGGNPITSTVMARAGHRSLRIQGFAGGEDLAIRRFGSMRGNTEVWFHDDGSSSIQRLQIYGAGVRLDFGVNDWDVPGFYSFFDGVWRSTGIARTVGWHHFRINITTSGISAWINDVPVITNNLRLTAFDDYQISGHRLRPSTGYWDNFIIRKHTSPEPSTAVGAEEASFLSGDFISSAIDTGQSSDFTTLGFTVARPTSTDLRFQLRSATTSAELAAAPWVGPDGTALTHYTGSGTTINPIHDGHRWIQYRAFFSTTDITVTPTLSDITINYRFFPTSAGLTSSPFNTGDPANILDRISWTQSLPAGTTIRFQVRTAPNVAGAPGIWTPWAGPCDGVSGTFATTTFFTDHTGGQLIDADMRDGINDQWIQYRVWLDTASPAFTPTLLDITLSYFEVGIIRRPIPIISDIEVIGIASNQAVIIWKTDIPAISWIEYGTCPAYRWIEEARELTSEHRTTLSNLKPDTMYHFRVISDGERGGRVISYDHNFRTLAIKVIEVVKPPVEIPPVGIIEAEEIREIPIIEAKAPIVIEIKETDITEITITTLINVSNIPLKVQQLIEKPVEVPEAQNIAYQYFNITLGIKPEDIDESLIEFKVSKSWINELNIDKETIVLNRFDALTAQWIALPTEFIREDGEYLIFSATTPHFSIFAITGQEAVIMPVVEPIPVESIIIDPETISLAIGERYTFTTDVLPADADQRVIWSVEDPTIGTIDADGLFTAIKEGRVTVAATSAADPTIIETAIVTVMPVEAIPDPEPRIPTSAIIIIVIIVILGIIALILLRKKKL